jgi:hypothetical protein
MAPSGPSLTLVRQPSRPVSHPGFEVELAQRLAVEVEIAWRALLEPEFVVIRTVL